MARFDTIGDATDAVFDSISNRTADDAPLIIAQRNMPGKLLSRATGHRPETNPGRRQNSPRQQRAALEGAFLFAPSHYLPHLTTNQHAILAYEPKVLPDLQGRPAGRITLCLGRRQIAEVRRTAPQERRNTP
jgi:hypothetical protein